MEPGGGAQPQGQTVAAEITVEFPRGAAPNPAFCSFCVVHRFPEYVIIDMGSIDPLAMQPLPGGGHRATLQHIGRVCLTDSAARQLWRELGTALGIDARMAEPPPP